MLATDGEPGQTYNISGSRTYQVRQLVDSIRERCRVPFEVRVDPSLLRASDEKIIFGDSSRLRQRTGWQQSVSIDKTLQDMMDYWREAP